MKTSPTEGPITETPTGVLRRQLAAARSRHPVNQVRIDEATFGERMADKVAGAIGTWRFLIGQGLVIVAWILANVLLLLNRGWDPYPFILLNLMFSVQAAYTGPVLLLAGNRAAYGVSMPRISFTDAKLIVFCPTFSASIRSAITRSASASTAASASSRVAP